MCSRTTLSASLRPISRTTFGQGNVSTANKKSLDGMRDCYDSKLEQVGVGFSFTCNLSVGFDVLVVSDFRQWDQDHMTGVLPSEELKWFLQET